MKMMGICGAMCAALAAAGGNAFAGSDDKPAWYGDVDVGRTSLKMKGSDLDGAFGQQGITSSGSSIDRHDTAWGLNIGYRFNRNFGLEGGYIDLGKYGYSAPVTAPAADLIQGRFRAHAWSLAPVGFLPLSREWDLFGKVGVTSTRAELSAGSTSGLTTPTGGSHTNTGWVFGGGATYDFSKNLYGRLELDRYSRVGDAGTTGKGNVDVLGAGLGFRF